MQRSESSALAAILLIGAMSVAAEDATVVRHPLEVGTAVDIGQIVKGEKDDFTSKPTDGQILQRTAVYLNQVTTVNNRLEIRVGVGGMFFYGYPEGLKPESRAVRFGPGVGQAQGIFMFGDPENPYLRAQIGFFPYKYNPDAKNLGEYLLRSGTYPGYEVTGGWSLLNSANYMASGLRLHGSMMEDKLTADLNMFMERDLDPIYDISPSILATYKPSSVFEIGAGAQFSHLIPVAPRKVKGRYWRYDETKTDTVLTPTATGTDTTIIAAPILVPATSAGPNAKRYTFAGTKLMARAALNLGALFDSPFIGPEGLKLYTEVALLGVKDYPYFYAKKIQRMPIMLGLNLPTFGFFDMLSVEYEYRQWGFPNSTADVQDNFEPVYTIPSVLDSTFDGTTWTKGLAQKWYKYDPNHPVYYVDESGGAGTGPFKKVNVSEGNQKWSIFMKKQFLPGFAIYAQAASDHLRLIRYADNTFSREVTTRKPSQWYYVVRLDFGI
jgi:hypothetical protein